MPPSVNTRAGEALHVPRRRSSEQLSGRAGPSPALNSCWAFASTCIASWVRTLTAAGPSPARGAEQLLASRAPHAHSGCAGERAGRLGCPRPWEVAPRPYRREAGHRSDACSARARAGWAVPAPPLCLGSGPGGGGPGGRCEASVRRGGRCEGGAVRRGARSGSGSGGILTGAGRAGDDARLGGGGGAGRGGDSEDAEALLDELVHGPVRVGGVSWGRVAPLAATGGGRCSFSLLLWGRGCCCAAAQLVI